MKWIKLFEELESGHILNVEEMSDYFLEFLDTGDLEFKSIMSDKIWDPSGYHIIDTTIHITYSIDKKYIRITDPKLLSKFSEFISAIESICRRWNLKFKLYMGGYETGGESGCSLTITQIAPKKITEWLTKYNLLTDTFYQKPFSWTGSSESGIFKGYNRGFKIDEDINFYLLIRKFRNDKTTIPPAGVPKYFEKEFGVEFVKSEGDAWIFKIPC
jgi:hypothetical protein